MFRNFQKGFTLLEILIVVLIILIIVSIGYVNYAEFEIRAKVSRTKADLRTVAVAVEAYFADYSTYPLPTQADGTDVRPYPIAGPAFYHSRIPTGITTPISYIETRMHDVFQSSTMDRYYFHYGTRDYVERDPMRRNTALDYENFVEGMMGEPVSAEFYILSHGPDRDGEEPFNPTLGTEPMVYDPTNGTVSNGDISWVGPGGLTN